MADTETRVERERRGWRKVFKKEIDDLKAVLEGNDPDEVRVQSLMRGIDQMQEELLRLDSLYWEQMMEDDDVDDEDVDEELEEVAGFKRNYHEIVAKVDKLNRKSREDAESNTGNASKNKKGCSYRLPKLEFKKFGGDPKDWLYFWSQFQSIHEDKEMRTEEKFQYLMQATETGSEARNVVDSFPPTAANYPKAIEYLEERFGNKEVLVEVYIRSLLGIVLHEQRNGMSSLATLYDQLATQLRSLESLEITTDKYGAMLFPLVESSLPEETLRAWERARILANETLRKDKLKHLMAFLKQEVDGEERIRMAQQFQSVGHCEKTVKMTLKKPVPTTTDLFNGGDVKNKRACIFCDRTHADPPSECSKAKLMTLEQKRKIIYAKKACYRCLLVGHRSKDCYSKTTCQNCKKEHDVSICPEIMEDQDNSDVVEVATDRTLSNHSKEAGILLQTLMVKVIHDGCERKVRAIIDTGSMRSYITKKAVDVLKLPSSGSVSLKHGLFGGTDTKEISHNLYDVRISSLEDNFTGTFSMMDQVQICGPVSRIPTGTWLKEFEEKQITFSDVGWDCPEIHVLFGADSVGKLFTGNVHPSVVGPLAMQTSLGWTVIGEIPLQGRIENQPIVTLTNLSRDVGSIWNLEARVIKDAIQIIPELEKSRAVEHKVSIPWITDHPPVADNLGFSLKKEDRKFLRLLWGEEIGDSDRKLLWDSKVGCDEEVSSEAEMDKDASSVCVFLRSHDGSKVAVQLIVDMSRVGPKNGTIPRWELPGCLIGPRLVDHTEDEKDPVTLTPSMFRVGYRSFGNPDLDHIDLVGVRMLMMKELRQRFRSEYLGKLKNVKNPVQSDEVKVGDLVLVEKETLKKSFWPIGVIEELHRDKQGTVRRATVKTSDDSKVFTLQRLFLMEVNVATGEDSSKNLEEN